jgi:hypothetical protein
MCLSFHIGLCAIVWGSFEEGLSVRKDGLWESKLSNMKQWLQRGIVTVGKPVVMHRQISSTLAQLFTGKLSHTHVSGEFPLCTCLYLKLLPVTYRYLS